MNECKHKYVEYTRAALMFYGIRRPKGMPKSKKVKNHPKISVRCSKCNHVVDRDMTSAEVKKYAKKDRDMHKECVRLHKVWHKFRKEFFDEKAYKWKYTGYDLMCKVEAYARRNKSIVITRCDDAMHMGADLVLIPHRNAEGYWGTTVMYISQADIQPTEFFLYPNYETGLCKGLTEAKQKRWKR